MRGFRERVVKSLLGRGSLLISVSDDVIPHKEIRGYSKKIMYKILETLHRPF